MSYIFSDKMKGTYMPPMYRPKRMEDRGDNAAIILKSDGSYIPVYFINPIGMRFIINGAETTLAEVIFLDINEKFFDGFVCKVADRLTSEMDN